MQELKKQILKKCLDLIEQRISTNTKILEDLSASMEGETKSSAGDKFETSRAMMQADQERYKAIVITAKGLRQQLSVLSLESADLVRKGSLVITPQGKYFIAVGLGKIELSETIYVISNASPIGRLLIGKRAGDAIVFNGRNLEILEVY